ncbi:hypothetical protein PAEPH01_0605 [Pancytospora epiphaga]|nr:hypothetical protein PAEPH01_0605 [Pancytospora epiphaga]
MPELIDNNIIVLRKHIFSVSLFLLMKSFFRCGHFSANNGKSETELEALDKKENIEKVFRITRLFHNIMNNEKRLLEHSEIIAYLQLASFIFSCKFQTAEFAKRTNDSLYLKGHIVNVHEFLTCVGTGPNNFINIPNDCNNKLTYKNDVFYSITYFLFKNIYGEDKTIETRLNSLGFGKFDNLKNNFKNILSHLRKESTQMSMITRPYMPIVLNTDETLGYVCTPIR